LVISTDGLEIGGHLQYCQWMASLGTLVEVIASATGVDAQRVGAVARSIREAGLLASSGRGPSAAQMGAADAANLLIAINGADTAREAPEAVCRFRALRTNQKQQNREFGPVLEEIIEAAVGSELVEYLFRLYGLENTTRYEQRGAVEDFDLRIEFELHRPMAVIESCIPTNAIPLQQPFYPHKSADRIVPDRRTINAIGHRTILAVAEVMPRSGSQAAGLKRSARRG
jgi:hypothetical protein